GLLFERGELVEQGPAAEVVRTYAKSLESAALQPLASRRDRSGEGNIRLTSVRLSNPDPDSAIATGDAATFEFAVSRCSADLECSFSVYDGGGSLVTYFDSADRGPDDVRLASSSGPGTIVCEVDELLLLPGRY